MLFYRSPATDEKHSGRGIPWHRKSTCGTRETARSPPRLWFDACRTGILAPARLETLSRSVRPMHLLEDYLRDLHEIRSTGAAVQETSFYPSLANLLNAVGHTLKPRVRCVMNLKNQGAGM